VRARPMPRRRVNTQSHQRPASQGRVTQHVAAWHGYNDALQRLDFSVWYSAADRDTQLAYEVGRHWVTNIRTAGLTPPPWALPGPPPEAVQKANVLAAERGEAYATPWGVMPDTDDPVLLEPLGRLMKSRRRRR
jgi:hypothetical protein